jgi:predicted metal-dependent hydrolase
MVRFLLVDPGPMRRMLRDYLDYYKPDFHPWDHDNRGLITHYVENFRARELRAA